MTQMFGIFSEDIELDLEKINKIFALYQNDADVVLFTDNINSIQFQHRPMFPSFYMRFFNGCVIFLNVEDYLEFKDKIKSTKKILLDSESIKNTDRSLINYDDILIIE